MRRIKQAPASTLLLRYPPSADDDEDGKDGDGEDSDATDVDKDYDRRWSLERWAFYHVPACGCAGYAAGETYPTTGGGATTGAIIMPPGCCWTPIGIGTSATGRLKQQHLQQ